MSYPTSSFNPQEINRGYSSTGTNDFSTDSDSLSKGSLGELSSAEAKRYKRMLQNRQSAELSRKRKADKMAALIQKVKELEESNRNLSFQLEEAKRLSEFKSRQKAPDDNSPAPHHYSPPSSSSIIAAAPSIKKAAISSSSPTLSSSSIASSSSIVKSSSQPSFSLSSLSSFPFSSLPSSSKSPSSKSPSEISDGADNPSSDFKQRRLVGESAVSSSSPVDSVFHLSAEDAKTTDEDSAHSMDSHLEPCQF